MYLLMNLRSNRKCSPVEFDLLFSSQNVFFHYFKWFFRLLTLSSSEKKISPRPARPHDDDLNSNDFCETFYIFRSYSTENIDSDVLECLFGVENENRMRLADKSKSNYKKIALLIGN